MKRITPISVLGAFFTLLFFCSFNAVTAQPVEAYELFLVNVKSGNVEQLTNTEELGVFNASFSNNGKQIVADGVFPFGFQALGIVDTKTGDGEFIPGGEGGNDASWSPNGEMIIFDVFFPTQRLYVLPPEGGVPTLVREFGIDAEWAQNSEWVVFYDTFTGGLKALNVATGDEYIVSSFGFHPTWSPNGQWIAFTDGNNIFKVEVDCTGTPLDAPIQLTDDAPGIFSGQPSWSNNSKTIVFHSNRGGDLSDFNIWTVSDEGTNISMLAGFEGVGDFDPCYSKNGKWIVFSSAGEAAPEGGGGGSSEAQSDMVILEQNFPNPFSQETMIQFTLPKASQFEIQVFDPAGALVKILGSGEFEAGINQVRWHGTNEKGTLLPNRLYTCRFVTEDQIFTQRMIFIR